MFINLMAAAAGEGPQTEFGFMEAMKQGGPIAWTILAVLVIMSVGSFYAPTRWKKALPSSTRTAHGARWSTIVSKPRLRMAA